MTNQIVVCDRCGQDIDQAAGWVRMDTYNAIVPPKQVEHGDGSQRFDVCLACRDEILAWRKPPR